MFANRLIKQEFRNQTGILNLSNCNIDKIPDSISELYWLEILILSNAYLEWDFKKRSWVHHPPNNHSARNIFTEIPANISSLKKLKTLVISGDSDASWGISCLKPLEGLSELEEIYFSNNKITDLTPLSDLKKLKVIGGWRNDIEDISSLRNLGKLNVISLWKNAIEQLDSLGDMPYLNHLDLSYNKISHIVIGSRFSVLQYLDLSNNLLKDITILSEMSDTVSLDILWEKQFRQGIGICNNPINIPPIEIIQQGASAIKNYFRGKEKEGTEKIYEAKLIIVGRGSVGKTTLARKLTQGKTALMPTEDESTKGIDVQKYEIPLDNDRSFLFHVWDFGGQEIYHATHQFFLTRRSLYLLVDDTRDDDQNLNVNSSFSYWLKVIELLGESSPVIIVQNEKGNRSKDLDEPSMRKAYPNIRKFVRANLADYKNLDEIRKAIKKEALALPHVENEVPKKWLAIRKSLEKLCLTHSYISLEKYLQICTKEGLDELSAMSLSNYLHDLGIFLHFQKDYRLKNTFILRHDWATKAVYQLLDNKNVKENNGTFGLVDLEEVWNDKLYRFKHTELLSLMDKFELCFPLEAAAKEEKKWLTPLLLPVATPDYNWDNKNNIVCKYQYDFMPKGIIPRLIVRMYPHLKDLDKAWQNGVVLQFKETNALIKHEFGSDELEIKVRGAEARKFVTILMEEVDLLNEQFKLKQRINVKKKIPCNCVNWNGCDEPYFFNESDILRRQENNIKEIQCNRCFKDLLLEDILNGIKVKYKRPRLFISYSSAHKDIELYKEFEKNLFLLEQQRRIEKWSKLEIEPGQSRVNIKKEELEKADIILFLLSADLLGDRERWVDELKPAIERHHNNEAIIIPIYLRKVDLTDTLFEKLDGLPKNKNWIDSSENKDEAFTEVITGIREVLDNWD